MLINVVVVAMMKNSDVFSSKGSDVPNNAHPCTALTFSSSAVISLCYYQNTNPAIYFHQPSAPGRL